MVIQKHGGYRLDVSPDRPIHRSYEDFDGSIAHSNVDAARGSCCGPVLWLRFRGTRSRGKRTSRRCGRLEFLWRAADEGKAFSSCQLASSGAQAGGNLETVARTHGRPKSARGACVGTPVLSPADASQRTRLSRRIRRDGRTLPASKLAGRPSSSAT